MERRNVILSSEMSIVLIEESTQILHTSQSMSFKLALADKANCCTLGTRPNTIIFIVKQVHVGD